MGQKRKRLDVLLAGAWFVYQPFCCPGGGDGRAGVGGGRQVDKPGTLVDAAAEIIVKELPRYVSRGGLKLEKALTVFGIDLSGRVAMDVGASTGGFTDCMLQHGARRVYSVDVGYGQLDWRLRQDERVISLERTTFAIWILKCCQSRCSLPL